MMEVCAVKPFGVSGASGGSLEFLPVAINLDSNVAAAPARPRKIKTNQVCLSCHPGQAVNLLSASIKQKETHRAVTRSSAGKHPRRHK